jgi:DNA polymerase-3 subunit epsilon
MSLFGKWRGANRNKDAQLDAPLAARLQACLAMPPVDMDAPFNRARMVVADVETTGLDVTRDHLVAIGAVAVVDGAIFLDDSFEVTLKQKAPSSDENILVHRIRGSEQLSGVEPAEALIAFIEFVGNAPLVGFHSHFDEIMLARAYEQFLGAKVAQKWLDLRELGPALHTDKLGRVPPGLDDWLAQLGIVVAHRHHATADAMATAKLLQNLLDLAPKQDCKTFAALHQLAGDTKWLRHR